MSDGLSRRGFLRLIGATSAVIAVPSLWVPAQPVIVSRFDELYLSTLLDAIAPYNGYMVALDQLPESAGFRPGRIRWAVTVPKVTA